MSAERDRRAEILDAAFAEFASKGFRGATIKSIARAAGIQSPALIYWYFPTKQELFRAVLATQTPLMRTVGNLTGLLDQPPAEVLPLLAEAYFVTTATEQVRTFMRLTVVEATQHPELAREFIQEGPLRVLGFLEMYLTRQVALGRLRPHNVKVSSRALMGMLLPQVLAQQIFTNLDQEGPTNAEYLQTSITIFLNGLAPTTNEGAAS